MSALAIVADVVDGAVAGDRLEDEARLAAAAAAVENRERTLARIEEATQARQLLRSVEE